MTVHFTYCPFVVCRTQFGTLEESIGAEDVISLSDIVPNANKCSVSVIEFLKFLRLSLTLLTWAECFFF